MQLGFDVAMGGDALKSEEFNRLQQEKNYDKVVKDYSKKIDNLITQTQQETLEWVLKEVVGEDEKLDDDWRYPDGVIWDGRCQLKEEMRQTIKQRMEEK